MSCSHLSKLIDKYTANNEVRFMLMPILQVIVIANNHPEIQ